MQLGLFSLESGACGGTLQESVVMEHQEQSKTIGFWLNEKKCKKFDVTEFISECRKLKMEVVKLDLSVPLAQQGPFSLILHKMTSVYAQALDGNVQARAQAEQFEQWVYGLPPSVVVVDPVPGVHTLLHRPATYALLTAITRHDRHVMTPPYVELPAGTDPITKQRLLAAAGLTFPIVCKPVFGCGGTEAHELAVVLSEGRVAEWGRSACVAQSFVAHGAVLYKLYVLGPDCWHLVKRPSLKNFRATDAPTVHFNSAKVSKAASCSPLTQLDHSDKQAPPPRPDHAIFRRIVRLVQRSLQMELLGIDVVIDSLTGRYAVIDVNPFPSYDSIADLHSCLAQLLRRKIDAAAAAPHSAGQQQRGTSSIRDLLPEACGGVGAIDVQALLKRRGHVDDPRLLLDDNTDSGFSGSGSSSDSSGSGNGSSGNISGSSDGVSNGSLDGCNSGLPSGDISGGNCVQTNCVNNSEMNNSSFTSNVDCCENDCTSNGQLDGVHSVEINGGSSMESNGISTGETNSGKSMWNSVCSEENIVDLDRTNEESWYRSEKDERIGSVRNGVVSKENFPNEHSSPVSHKIVACENRFNGNCSHVKLDMSCGHLIGSAYIDSVPECAEYEAALLNEKHCRRGEYENCVSCNGNQESAKLNKHNFVSSSENELENKVVNEIKGCSLMNCVEIKNETQSNSNGVLSDPSNGNDNISVIDSTEHDIEDLSDSRTISDGSLSEDLAAYTSKATLQLDNLRVELSSNDC